MAEQRKIKRKAKKKRPGGQKRRRHERRFLPRTTNAAWAMFALGMLGALALGAGVFGHWIKDPPIDYAIYLVSTGGVALAVALWFGDLSGFPVRIGDAGIAMEKGTDLLRVPWCDLERVSVERGNLLVKTAESTFALSISAHPQAVAWVLSEGTARMPDVIAIKRRQLKELPKPEEDAGEVLEIEGMQVAGSYCRASEKLISFERDARICPNCCEVYHHLHVPKTCATCEQPLAERALAP
jgi:hypothetical protein